MRETNGSTRLTCAAERSGSLINDENCKSVAERAGAAHFLNATIVRAHQHAAGARKGKRGGCPGHGWSRSGLSTKIHAASAALGNPVRLIGSPGQRNDIAFAHALVANAAITDKDYDADHLCDRLTQAGVDVVIPPKRNRKVQRSYDAQLYKERNLIERFFNKLKQFRSVATRYDKLLVVKLAAIAIWLRSLNRHYGLGCSFNRSDVDRSPARLPTHIAMPYCGPWLRHGERHWHFEMRKSLAIGSRSITPALASFGSGSSRLAPAGRR